MGVLVKMDIMELRAKGKKLEPVVRLGKSGVSDAFVKEVEKLLKKRKLIKIKMLKSGLGGSDSKEIAKELAEKTGSVLVELVGMVIVLYRK